VLVPPAINAVMSDPTCIINGFLAAGHVCTIMGTGEYYPLAEKFKIPIVVTGFEPVDLLEGILMTVKQLEANEYKVQNQYARVVLPEGNKNAVEIISKVFTIANREWRGLGEIPLSGYELREIYSRYDANKKFSIHIETCHEDETCLSGDIMKGKNKKPYQCPHFGKSCTPLKPLGAPMVSSEGACAAYYHFHQKEIMQEA